MINKDLRIKIVEMIKRSGEGHIPSSFSIVDIIEHLYSKVLKFKKNDTRWVDRDYFILSKGHGCAALYVVLEKYGIIDSKHLVEYGNKEAILAGHPDSTKIPGVEASTGSLGHGFPMAVGLALGLKILNKSNRVFVLLGDGECHEGTIWEAAHVANNLRLGNMCAVIDWNGSAAKLMPRDDLHNKWKSFGWNTNLVDGHNLSSLDKAFRDLKFSLNDTPNVLIAKTIKGKGVSFIEGHGKWHHKMPSNDEITEIMKELKS